MSDESVMQSQDGPGSAVYNPSYTEPDDLVLFRTRSTKAATPNDAPGIVQHVAGEQFVPPSPTVGGKPRQFGALGWSNGFLAFRRRSAFTGRTLVVPNMGPNPATGQVGFSTRSQRLRNRVAALTTDYTPTQQEVSQEIVNNV